MHNEKDLLKKLSSFLNGAKERNENGLVEVSTDCLLVTFMPVTDKLKRHVCQLAKFSGHKEDYQYVSLEDSMVFSQEIHIEHDPGKNLNTMFYEAIQASKKMDPDFVELCLSFKLESLRILDLFTPIIIMDDVPELISRAVKKALTTDDQEIVDLKWVFEMKYEDCIKNTKYGML